MNIKVSVVVLLLFCGSIQATDVESFAEIPPPAKRIRVYYHIPGTPCNLSPKQKSDMLLETIKSYGDAGCPYEDLMFLLHPSRLGAVATLEFVVNLMFKENVDIDYNGGKYYFVGPASTTIPPPNLLVLIVNSLMQPSGEQDSVAALAYVIFKKGGRAKGFSDFQKVYYAARLLCNFQLTEALRVVKSFFMFALEASMPNPEKIAAFEATQKKKVKTLERWLIRYIWGLSPETLETVIKIREKANKDIEERQKIRERAQETLKTTIKIREKANKDIEERQKIIETANAPFSPDDLLTMLPQVIGERRRCVFELLPETQPKPCEEVPQGIMLSDVMLPTEKSAFWGAGEYLLPAADSGSVFSEPDSWLRVQDGGELEVWW